LAARFPGYVRGEPPLEGEVEGRHAVGAILVVLLLALILGGLGFMVHVLWWVAVLVLVVWIIGWAFAAGSGGGRRRWYGRW
jgi:hypothetical protein